MDVAGWTVAGSEFHNLGAYVEKAWVPKLFAKRPQLSVLVLLDLKLLGMVFAKRRWLLKVDGLVDSEAYFEMNTRAYRQPVKIVKKWIGAGEAC